MHSADVELLYEPRKKILSPHEKSLRYTSIQSNLLQVKVATER
jgi:hypothetical protein